MSATDERDGRGGQSELEENGDGTEWEVVWHAPNHALGGMVKSLLSAEGLLVMMRSMLGIPHLGFSGPVEILVPADMADEARTLVEAFIGAGGAGLTEDPEDEQEGDPELPDDDEDDEDEPTEDDDVGDEDDEREGAPPR